MCGIFCTILNKNCVNYEVQNHHECLENTYKKCMVNLNRRGPDYQYSTNIQIENWHLFLSSTVLWLQGLQLVKQPVETEKSWFLYNGDIFDSTLLLENIRNEKGDTQPLLNVIEESECLIKTLQQIHGPYAFIYIDKVTSKLYFARDLYGRRSLLISKDNEKILLSSVLTREIDIPTIELPALGVYCIDLKENPYSLSLFPWKAGNQHFQEKLDLLQSFLSFEILVHEFGEYNSDIIFSEPMPQEINIYENMENMIPDKVFSLLMKDDVWNSNVTHLNCLLESAIEKRVKNQPQFCVDCIKERLPCNHAAIGILFSGGLDCAIISLIADKFIDKSRQIDLMNVAFGRNNDYNTPDRITARQTFEELKRLRPDRKWNLLEINITLSELNVERSNRIADLIYPLRSILDESLGCALWFASRGKTEYYTTPSRVLFVGMGADELFGGYSRHRAAFKRGSWMELTTELDNDWKNISHRNLARDDRVVSDHGRQLRTPYLDEHFVEFVRKLKAWERCYPSEKVQGLGDKLLLRTLAFHLGLSQAAVLRKRALQFGSRIANSKENANDISPRL